MRTGIITLLVVALAAAGSAQMSLSTTYVGGNGQEGNMWDMTASGGADVLVLSFDANLTNSGTVEIWYRTDPIAGHTGSSAGWIQVGSTSVTGLGAGNPTPIPIPINITIPAGQTYGWYLHNSGSVTYTNGTSVGMVYASDTYLSILEGYGGTYFALTYSPRVWNGTVYYEVGPSCSINSPAPGATVSSVVPVNFDVDHTLGLPMDVTIVWSTDAGTTWAPGTPWTGVNPILGVPTPSLGMIFEWDSVADGIGDQSVQTTELRVEVDDGTTVGGCTAAGLQVDNRAPSPTCIMTLTSGTPVRNVATFDVDVDSLNTTSVDATFEFSTDAGTTWSLATPDPTSANPIMGIPITINIQFLWDTRADNLGMSAPVTGVLFRTVVADGVAPVDGTCIMPPFDVDNTSLCPSLCSDCDLNGTAPAILDALVAAQIAASLLAPSTAQAGCCDVNTTMSITVLDALRIAQASAGITVPLDCP
jgi:hypothetical protein